MYSKAIQGIWAWAGIINKNEPANVSNFHQQETYIQNVPQG